MVAKFDHSTRSEIRLSQYAFLVHDCQQMRCLLFICLRDTWLAS